MLTRSNVQERGGDSGGGDLSPTIGCCGIPTSYSSHSHQAAGMSQTEKPSCLSSIKSHLRETLQKSSSDNEKRRLTADMQKPQQQQSRGINNEDDPAAVISAREENIEKRKLEVRQRVQARYSKVEVEARSLDNLRKELEGLEDPTKKEVTEIRKKIEAVEKELKPLKQLCEKKEKEFHDTVKQHEEKVKIKSDLVNKLMETVNKGEGMRMKRLDDLIANFESLAAAEAEKNRNSSAAAPAANNSPSSISPAPASV